MHKAFVERWLTCHAIPLGSGERGRVHICDATRSEVVERLLYGEVEKPVIVIGQQRFTIELRVRGDKVGNQAGVASLVYGKDMRCCSSEKEADGHNISGEHGGSGIARGKFQEAGS